MSADQSIPSFLETPPTSRVKPPVETRPQDLPFGELTWTDFEKLCLRLARLEADVEHCQLYGVKGQKQEGIDILARVREGSAYRVYQCKREKKFGAAKIRRAVTTFLEGRWKRETQALILCTNESLRPKGRADEIKSQATVLRHQKITLETWDCHELSLRLKEHCDIVDDFFGREWVRVFCGDNEAKRLSGRLDSRAVAEFRAELASFYRLIYSTHDPGLPCGPLSEEGILDLERRFVIPDVYDERLVHAPEQQTPAGNDRSSPFFSHYCANEQRFEAQKRALGDRKPIRIAEERQDIERWLSNRSFAPRR